MRYRTAARIALFSWTIVIAACGASARSTTPTATPTETPAARTPTTTATATPTPATSSVLDCGRVEQELQGCAPNAEEAARCFVAAFQANRAARLVWRGTSDEGGHTTTEYTVVPRSDRPQIVALADAREDGYSVAPEIRMQCGSGEVAESSLGCFFFNPRACVCDPAEAC